ncbi:hypothetical protein [Enemella evansiae]|uniref:hypothetical protein n=1 Tax=Enemella evansiae TaxID=2016499 RepID=UPI000B96A238|nr:hypothetical protein [Enemella evansiae]OYO11323.1 hypothetical protein BI335_15885 [Enemella evansiae]TDO87948.1 hypothetical protein C8D81_3021 [Enemella evansiae]
MELATVAKQGIEFARSRPILSMAYPYACAAAGVVALVGLFVGMRPLDVVRLALESVGVDMGWLTIANEWSLAHEWLLGYGWVILFISFWIITLVQLGVNARVYSTFWLALAVGLQGGTMTLTTFVGYLGLPLLIWLVRNRRGTVGSDWIGGLLLALATVLMPLFWMLDPGRRFRATQ